MEIKFLLLVIILTVNTTFATTNVNISFTQQHLSSAPQYVQSRNHQAQLKSFDSAEKYSNNIQNARFARIQLDDKKNDSDLKQPVSATEAKNKFHSIADVSREDPTGFVSSSQTQNQARSLYRANYGEQYNQVQLKNLSPQDKQNMEFERYIQNYHSGPTVETVFETAKPDVKSALQTSSANEGLQHDVSIKHRSSNVAKFERQIALPAKMDNAQATADHKTVQIQESSPMPIPSAVASHSTSSSSSVSSGNTLNVPINQTPITAGHDGFSYNKPDYNDPSFKHNDGHSDSHLYNQFPPSLEEPQGGYGEYYGNVYNGYNPVEQRPVVTKTIQIAQPAIKAKKYEVRHPAIQKEFYDIEERVVIKPAGTVVVELERPSAKILKEETTLPLGHPHPAVASAYMSNKQNPTFSNIIYSNAGPSSSNPINNQYIPQQTYNNKNLANHRSHSHDKSSKELMVDHNSNQQYNGENYYAVGTNLSALKSKNRDIVVLTDSHGNQRQVSTDQFSYSRDETKKVPSRNVYNQRSSFSYEDNERVRSQTNVSPYRSENKEEFDLDAEYINNSGNHNYRKETKPARLQEFSTKVSEEQQQLQPIIKHEHKIVLSPSQHNIYLSRNQEQPAPVREINPHSQNHRNPVVVYASTKTNSEMPYSQRSEYQSKSRGASQVVQFRESPRFLHSNIAKDQVKYSAPYAQMKLHSNNEPVVYHRQENIATQSKSGKLILEGKTEMIENKTYEENSMNKEKEGPQAHIQIKIPSQSSYEIDKDIVINSTIRPIMIDGNLNQMHNSKLEISVTNNGEPHAYQHSFSERNSTHNNNSDDNGNRSGNSVTNENDAEILSNFKMEPDCDKSTPSFKNENYKDGSDYQNYRIVEGSGIVSSSANDASAAIETSANQGHNVEVNEKSTVGHVSPPGSRVIAATPAAKEATPSESFHKRRIVVNHPFQTVREVVEHEPYTNYHEVQVNEPATPALYHSGNYLQSY